MIEIVNQQRKVKIDPKAWQEFAEQAIEAIEAGRGKTATIAFVSDCRMREMNRIFRGKDATTDVLSFGRESDEFEDSDKTATGFGSDDDNLGEIAISAEQAARQAVENNLTLELEVKQLILHGILHLCGYDHETDAGEMNALELKLRDKLAIQ